MFFYAMRGLNPEPSISQQSYSRTGWSSSLRRRGLRQDDALRVRRPSGESLQGRTHRKG